MTPDVLPVHTGRTRAGGVRPGACRAEAIVDTLKTILQHLPLIIKNQSQAYNHAQHLHTHTEDTRHVQYIVNQFVWHSNAVQLLRWPADPLAATYSAALTTPITVSLGRYSNHRGHRQVRPAPAHRHRSRCLYVMEARDGTRLLAWHCQCHCHCHCQCLVPAAPLRTDAAHF